MFFKGTGKYKVGEMDRIIKESGGYNNAGTSIENTHYYAVVSSENAPVAIDIILDAAINSNFLPEEIERERKVVKEEINRKEDDPVGKLYTEFLSLIFSGTPYGRPTLGTPLSLDGITRDSFLEYLRTYYKASNMVVAVAGDVNTKSVIKLVEEHTKGLTKDTKREANPSSFNFVPQDKVREGRAEKDVNQVYFIIGFPNRGKRDLKDSYVLDIASVVLGEGRSSRLYQKLLEKEGIVSSVSSWSMTLKKAGILGITATCRPQDYVRARSEIIEQINRLKTDGITPEELKKAKMKLKGDFAFSNETALDTTLTLGWYESFTKAEDALLYLSRINRISASEVKAAVKRWCDDKAYTLYAIVPKQNAARPGE
jgi:zinc protease